jgi:hypothetical protein
MMDDDDSHQQQVTSAMEGSDECYLGVLRQSEEMKLVSISGVSVYTYVLLTSDGSQCLVHESDASSLWSNLFPSLRNEFTAAALATYKSDFPARVYQGQYVQDVAPDSSTPALSGLWLLV